MKTAIESIEVSFQFTEEERAYIRGAHDSPSYIFTKLFYEIEMEAGTISNASRMLWNWFTVRSSDVQTADELIGRVLEIVNQVTGINEVTQ
mgnify:CR=1 FL=1|jgi:hypothetical protein